MTNHPRFIVSILLGMALANMALAEEAHSPPRLALWVTEAIGNNSADTCFKPQLSLSGVDLPSSTPTFTERDVDGWNPVTATLTITATVLVRNHSSQKLQNHCYILVVDNKVVSSGVMLASYSARLTKIDTIKVATNHQQVTLQLTAGHDAPAQMPSVSLINDVLRHKAIITTDRK